MKAIDLVRKVTSMGSALARRRGGARGDETDGDASGRTESLAMRASIRLIRVTTVVARQMQSMPMPAPRPAERIALSMAADQLRVLVDGALVTRDGADPSTREGEAVRALVELVAETLALVDKALAMDPQLARSASRELPRPPSRAGQPASPAEHAHAAEDEGAPPSAPATKVRF